MHPNGISGGSPFPPALNGQNGYATNGISRSRALPMGPDPAGVLATAAARDRRRTGPATARDRGGKTA
jgi:hypothetical protein